MFNCYLFLMGAGVGFSFWCILKFCEWNKFVFGNFWGPPILSSSCDNNYTYVKHVSFKNIILGRYKMMETPLRIHAKSLSDVLAPSKKNMLAALVSSDCARLPHLKPECPLFARFLPEGWSKGVCRLKQTCTPTGDDPKYVTTIPDVHIWITQSY